MQYICNYDMHYTKYLAILEEYNDANQISNTKDSKFISGYIFALVGIIVSWKSSKQMIIA